MNKVDQRTKDLLDKERFSYAINGFYDRMINKLNTEPNNSKKLLEDYFSYLKESSLRREIVEFKNDLNFLKEVVVPQANEKYEGNEKKYGSKEKYEKYQNELFDVLVEVNDYLWENYLFLDRSLRWKYADEVISKIDSDFFKRFLYTRKTENEYNKVLDNFFYRNMKSLILSEQQCHDLSLAFHKNVDKLPNWINQYIGLSNQNDSLTTLSSNFVTLTNKIESFDWSEKLDKNNKMARECLEDIKEVNGPHKDLFDIYANFLEKAVIPQINKFYYEEQHFSGLFEILVETNDLIWGILESNSLSEYEKNKLLACYYNCIIKINCNAWEKITSLLEKKKKEAIESRDKNKVAEYNRIVENFVLRNLKSDVISVNKLDNMGVINFIDEQTFEEYTDDSMSKKLLYLFACFEDDSFGLGTHIRPKSTIKFRKPGNNEKICFEAMFGGMMSGKHCPSSDTMLSLIKNSPDDIDFSFSSLSNKDVESNEEIKKFCLGFRSVYDDLKKNDFTIDISKPKLNVTKCFMYLGAWTVLFFPKNVGFDTVYTELNKRLDFLCDSHYGLPKLQINQKQKDKLIIQALVYATNALDPLSNDVKSIYRTLRMFTGEEKFVDGYKFSLDDMEKISSSTKNSVMDPYGVFKFCKNHRVKRAKPKKIRIFDILRLAKKMNISISGSKHSGCDVCLEDDRKGRINATGYRSISYNLFDKNDFEIYMSELLENPEEKEFDIWFPFFLTEPVLPEKRSSDENKKIRSFFSHLIDKIPNGYLQLEKFRSLVNYFANHNTENAISLTPDEFNKFMSKINKHMNKEDFESFKAITTKYFKINGQEISDQEIENAYNEDALNNVKNPTKSAFKDIKSMGIDDKNEENEEIEVDKIGVSEIVNESYHQGIDMSAPIPVYQNINEPIPVYQNINEVDQDQEDNNFEENTTNTPEPVYQNIYKSNEGKYDNIKPIANNNQNQTQNLNEFDKAAKLAQINNEIDREKKDFQDWISGKKQNNPLWVLIAWIFKLWFEHKFEQKRKSLEKTNGNSQPNNNFSKPKSEETPNINDKNKGENNRDPKD